jgi:hypothetical protein
MNFLPQEKEFYMKSNLWKLKLKSMKVEESFKNGILITITLKRRLKKNVMIDGKVSHMLLFTKFLT